MPCCARTARNKTKRERQDHTQVTRTCTRNSWLRRPNTPSVHSLHVYARACVSVSVCACACLSPHGTHLEITAAVHPSTQVHTHHNRTHRLTVRLQRRVAAAHTHTLTPGTSSRQGDRRCGRHGHAALRRADPPDAGCDTCGTPCCGRTARCSAHARRRRELAVLQARAETQATQKGEPRDTQCVASRKTSAHDGVEVAEHRPDHSHAHTARRREVQGTQDTARYTQTLTWKSEQLRPRGEPSTAHSKASDRQTEQHERRRGDDSRGAVPISHSILQKATQAHAQPRRSERRRSAQRRFRETGANQREPLPRRARQQRSGRRAPRTPHTQKQRCTTARQHTVPAAGARTLRARVSSTPSKVKPAKLLDVTSCCDAAEHSRRRVCVVALLCAAHWEFRCYESAISTSAAPLPPPTLPPTPPPPPPPLPPSGALSLPP
jgi:hypothetical protein